MPNESALLPTFGISQNPDGTVSANVTVPVAPIKSINWAALLQAVIAALPSILAIIAAFTGSPTPAPTPASTPPPVPAAPTAKN